jgi:hypothetical protein
MMKLQSLFLILLFNFLALNDSFASVPPPGPNDPVTYVQGLSAQKQERNQWCWAATTRMLLSAKLPNLQSQCEIVSNVFGLDCCTYSSLSCNRPYNLETAINKLGHAVIKGYPKEDPTQHWTNRIDYKGWYQSVVTAIKEGSPVAIAKLNASGTTDASSHVVVAFGTYRKGSQDYLIIYDSIDGKKKFWDRRYVVGNQAWIVTYTIK